MGYHDRMNPLTSSAPGAIGYFFCNHYMAGIHGGIQSLHAAVQMAVDFLPGVPGHEVFYDWATSSAPTAILLNAGYASRLERVACAIEAMNRNPVDGVVLPFARFHEGQEELNGALTAVALVVPGPWVASRYSVPEEELRAVLEQDEDPVDLAARMTRWSMPDRLRLLRHGMSLRS
jgi:hypothetical protein